MECRRFNSIMPNVNEIWAAKVLHLTQNLGIGPDLIGEDLFVEVKFSLIKPKDKREDYPRSWTVQNHQQKYPRMKKYKGKVGFWALGTYELDRPVSEIITTDPNELEERVLSRELTIIQWDWMKQFPVHKVSGRTNRSEWTNYFRYPKEYRFPQVYDICPVEKGRVYFTGGVSPNFFDILIPRSKTA
jgi:hypothetical protein